MAEDTWWTRDRIVLDATLRVWEQLYSQGLIPDSSDIVPETGLPAAEADLALKVLADTGYIDADAYGGGFIVTGISAAGRREVGAWPSPQSIASRILDEIDERAASATTEDERSRWAKLREAVASVGRDLLVDVTAAALTRHTGG